MGDKVPDVIVAGLLDRLNLRFAPGDAIVEMIALQKAFDVFSTQHSLRESFGLLNLGPINNWRDRRGWYKYLDLLRQRPSDKKGVNGEERVITVLRTHLANGEAIPVHFTSHNFDKDPQVKVSSRPKLALVYSTQQFLVISLPMTPIEKDRTKRRAKAE